VRGQAQIAALNSPRPLGERASPCLRDIGISSDALTLGELNGNDAPYTQLVDFRQCECARADCEFKYAVRSRNIYSDGGRPLGPVRTAHTN
jgi:hypothetical protein